MASSFHFPTPALRADPPPAGEGEDKRRYSCLRSLTKTPSFRLDGKRALVTGGGRGIGLAAASALAEAGAHVTIAARTKAEIEEAAAAIRARGETGRRAGARCDRCRGCAKGDCRRRAVSDPGQQRRHEPAGLSAGRQGRGFRRHLRAQCPRRLLHGAGGGDAADRGEIARLDHQYLLADGSCRRRAPHRLLRLQARHGGLHQGHGDRACAAQYPRQQYRSDVSRNADDAAILREQGVSRRGAVERSSSAGSVSSKRSPAPSSSWPRMRRR